MFAVLIDELRGYATVHSLHEDRAEADAQAEVLDDAKVRIATESTIEGERVRYDARECGELRPRDSDEVQRADHENEQEKDERLTGARD